MKNIDGGRNCSTAQINCYRFLFKFERKTITKFERKEEK